MATVGKSQQTLRKPLRLLVERETGKPHGEWK
jgi:hypothetical protein